jgi:hypothetical protein
MLHAISWKSYWLFIAVSTGIYYLFVYLNFFKRAIWSKGGLASILKEKKELSSFHTGMNATSTTDESIFDSCMDELNAFFDNQRKSKVVKPELVHGLYLILQKYPSLRHSDYWESLSTIIATQCEDICSIHLSVEELKGVWFG